MPVYLIVFTSRAFAVGDCIDGRVVREHRCHAPCEVDTIDGLDAAEEAARRRVGAKCVG